MTRVLFWGTYDLSKPRNRLLRDGLREAGAEVEECHEPVWENVRDKSELGKVAVLQHVVAALRSYPRLLVRFMRAPRPDVVLVGYMGQLDVVLLYPFARLRGVPVVWDQFISLYDTVVRDRAIVAPSNPVAAALWSWEWVACRCADRVWMDTRSHAEHIADLFHLPKGHVDSVWVGAETSAFQRAEGKRPAAGGELRVLFYGQFIPLHGVEVIVRAARELRSEAIHFTLIGEGQQAALVEEMLREQPLENLTWKRWVDYGRLVEELHSADVCLGIFGATGKASRVIPNKVFQVVSAGRALVTQDSPAIRELLSPDMPGVHLVPPGDPGALAQRLRELARTRPWAQEAFFEEERQRVSPTAIGRQVLAALGRIARVPRGR